MLTLAPRNFTRKHTKDTQLSNHSQTNIAHTFTESLNNSNLLQNPRIHSQSSSPTLHSSHSILFSSDDSDIHLFLHNWTTQMSSKPLANTLLATVKHNVVNQPPVVSPGELVPHLIYDLKQYCENYFVNTKTLIPEDKKVIHMFQDPLIHDWITSSHQHLSTLWFPDFINKLWAEFLPQDWEDKVWSQILNSHLSLSQSFNSWANSLQALNCTLRGTKSHLTPSCLQEQIEANIDDELQILGREANAFEGDSLRNMTTILQRCDEKWKLAKKCQWDIAEEVFHISKRPNNSTPTYKENRVPTNQSQNDALSSRSRCPKLTNDEWDLLNKNEGCWKYRKVFVKPGHPCEFPSGHNYKALTIDDVHRAQHTRNPGTTINTNSQAIASIAEINDSTNDTSSTLMDETDTNFVASMFGTMNTTSVIGDGSFSDGEVSVHPHIKSKHYVWNCLIEGPAVEFPIKISTLIDNGAHMVLICPELVAKLNLCIFLLHKPEVVDVAISTTTKKEITLSSYIKICATSLDGQWTSHTVYAVITPGLCMPIIFGLPFLEINSIVCDHKEQACIDKKTNYNLLHPEPLMKISLTIETADENKQATKSYRIERVSYSCQRKMVTETSSW